MDGGRPSSPSTRITERNLGFFLPCTIHRFSPLLLPLCLPPSLPPPSQLRVISTSNQLLAEDDLPICGFERCCQTDYLFVPSLPGEECVGWGGKEGADARLTACLCPRFRVSKGGRQKRGGIAEV